MTGLIRRQPWGLLGQLHDEMDRLFDNNLRSGNDVSQLSSDWVPAVDIREETDKYIIHADVPGVDPKNIEVTMDKGVLVIKGERKHESTEAGKGYKRTERVKGTFYRSFQLPDSVNLDGITAKGLNGVLEIVIPKGVTQKARTISVEG